MAVLPSFRWSSVLWPLMASLVLLSAGLYNGFPLVTSDTGTYLNSALHLTVPDDRPLTYGLFVRAAGLGFSLWLVVFFQCLLLGALLLRYVHELAPRLRHPAARLAVLVLGVWATGASWFSSQLMPDVFTAIGLLALGLVLLGRARTLPGRLALLAVVLLAELMHSANLLSYTLLVLGVGLLLWQTGRRAPGGRAWLPSRHWRLAAAVVLSGWLVLPALHLAFGGGFVISRASPAFLMARMSESGVLEQFLDRECATNQYGLCAYRDQLPDDAMTFMWDGNSPLQKAGGWNATAPEYRRIIGQILCSPRYYPQLVSEAAQATLRQLTHVGIGDGLTPFRENTNPYWKVGEYNRPELKEYMSSLQNRNALSFTSLNERVYLTYLLALMALLAGLGSHTVRRLAGAPAAQALAVLGLGVLANALVTGALANVLDRLQARVAWLLPFLVLVLAAELLLALWEGRKNPAAGSTAPPF